NALVTQATSTGITWVNAAGNFAKGTYIAPIERVADDWAFLPGPNNSVQVRCHSHKKQADEGKKADTCLLRAVLSWNSFSDDVARGTDKDLDLVLTDDTLKVIATGGMAQKRLIEEGAQGASLYPREIVTAEVKPGLYYLRVKVRSENFSKNVDELRLTVSGDFTEVLNRTDGESLLSPADHPEVITVGASDSDLSSFSRRHGRPDAYAISLLKTEDGGQFKGSSNSAAAVAARAAVELSRADLPEARDQKRANLIARIRNRMTNRPTHRNENTSVRHDFGSTTGHCYVFAVSPLSKPHVRQMLRDGGVVVETTMGIKAFIDEDPFLRASRLGLRVTEMTSPTAPRQGSHSPSQLIFVADRDGLFSTDSSRRPSLARDTIEFVVTPKGATFCPLSVR
ncbi:MAG: hypothetical protein RBT63_10710, partial [Bdellovibrionales bacterium]|nr:hypothetical protein [Bdellovibrionales bacterium]